MTDAGSPGDQRNLLSRAAAVIGESDHRAIDQVPNAPTLLQLRVLAALIGTDPTPNLTQVATVVGASVPTLSRVVDRLAAAGLVDRRPSPNSRREITLTVTRRGRRVTSDWERRRADELQRLLDELDPARRAAVVAGFTALLGDPIPADVSGPNLALLRSDLLRELRRSDPVQAADVLVAFIGDHTAAAAVCLRLVSHDGSVLHPIAELRARGAAAPGARGRSPIHFSSAVVDDDPPGAALLSGQLQIEDHGRWMSMHAPVTANPEALGTLTVVLPSELAPAARVSISAILQALAELAGVVLPTVTRGAQAPEGARRRREWTVTAEMQWAQLPGRRLRSQGFDLAAQIEPAWDACSDAYDWSAREGAIAAAVLTAGTESPVAPFVTALGLGALRHARHLGRTLSEQASLMDQALHAQFAGQLCCDGALVELTRDPLRMSVVATAGVQLFRHRRGRATRVTLATHSPWGGTGDSEYVASPVAVAAGDRFVLLSHGFAGRSASELTTAIGGLGAELPGPVVRHLIAQLLVSGGGEADTDATALCIDLAEGAVRRASAPA
jgi:DNA-binding MarR family transcriptional regulator